MTSTTTTTNTCAHETKWRQMGGDARLWKCRATGALAPGFTGCGALFVEGRQWLGEPQWIPVTEPIRCAYCVDGLCTSLDDKPCPRCGATSARPRTAEGTVTR